MITEKFKYLKLLKKYHKMKYKRGVAIGVIASVLALILIIAVLFFSLSTKVYAKDIKILLPSMSEHILYSYIWIAKEKGFFAEEGLNVEIAVTANEFPNIPAQVSFDPEVPFGVMNIESLFEKENYAPYLVPLDFFLYGSTYDTHLVVGKNSGIKTASDLKGKKVRVGFPPTIIALKKILNEAGLSGDDVKIVAEASHNVLDKIRTGEIDAAVTYFPTMPVMIASGDVEILKENLFTNYVNHHVPQSFIGVNKNFAVENPATVKKFLAAMKKAYAYGAENPVALITSYAKLKTFSDTSWILDDALIQKGAALIPKIPIRNINDNIYMEKLGRSESVYEHLIKYQNIMYDEGFIHEKLDMKVLVDNYNAFASSTS